MQFHSNEQWVFSQEWLIGIIEKVARQALRKIKRTSINIEDLRQDLFLEPAQDRGFIASLESCSDEAGAARLSYAFLDKTRKRLCRRYRAEWPQLEQFTAFEQQA